MYTHRERPRSDLGKATAGCKETICGLRWHICGSWRHWLSWHQRSDDHFKDHLVHSTNSQIISPPWTLSHSRDYSGSLAFLRRLREGCFVPGALPSVLHTSCCFSLAATQEKQPQTLAVSLNTTQMAFFPFAFENAFTCITSSGFWVLQSCGEGGKFGIGIVNSQLRFTEVEELS